MGHLFGLIQETMTVHHCSVDPSILLLLHLLTSSFTPSHNQTSINIHGFENVSSETHKRCWRRLVIEEDVIYFLASEESVFSSRSLLLRFNHFCFFFYHLLLVIVLRPPETVLGKVVASLGLMGT